MKQRLIKLIKSLKTFTLNDLQMMTECEDTTLIQDIIQELIKSGDIIENEEGQYSSNKVSIKPVLSDKRENVKDWIEINCKGDLNNLCAEKINPNKFFDKKEECEIYKTLNKIQKNVVIKYYTLYKLTKGYRGKSLYEIVDDISEKYPFFKCLGFTIVAKNRAYKIEGIKAFIPRNGYLPPERFSKEVLDKFEELYLNPKQYSYKHCIQLLELFKRKVGGESR